MTRRQPRLFISYCHEPESNRTRVENLVKRLRFDKIRVINDRDETSPPEKWNQWCIEKIGDADIVLMICTEEYHSRFRERSASGVGWEAEIILDLSYRGIFKDKFLPALFSDGSQDHIPIPFGSRSVYRVDDFSNEHYGYNGLFRHLMQDPNATAPSLQSWQGELDWQCLQAVPDFLNHDPALVEIEERLVELRDSGTGRTEPLLVVLEGDADDGLDILVQRFTCHELPRKYSPDRPPRAALPLDWRTGHNDAARHLRAVCGGLDLPWNWTCDDYQTYLSTECDFSYCFRHTIDRSCWNTDRGKSILTWIAYWCETWPTPPPTCLAVGFLVLNLPSIERDKAMKRIKNYLNQPDAPPKRRKRVLIPRPPEHVGRLHVDLCVQRVLHENRELDRLGRLTRLPDMLFPDPDERRPFKDVYWDLVRTISLMAPPPPMVPE